VVVTLGAQGAVVVTPEAATPVAAHSAGPVADTTGAGDCFTGAFAAALAEGRDPAAAARFAAVAAGISVTRLGAAASAPRRAEIDAALAAG
jgi:ribokinase